MPFPRSLKFLSRLFPRSSRFLLRHFFLPIWFNSASNYPAIHPSVHSATSIHPPIHPSTHPSVRPSIHSPIHPPLITRQKNNKQHKTTDKLGLREIKPRQGPPCQTKEL